MKESNSSYSVIANTMPIRGMKDANVAKVSPSLNPEEREEAIQATDRKMMERMKRRKQWTCESAKVNPNIAGLISVDVFQSPEEIAEEIEEKVKKMGAKGLKLHPIASAYYLWDQRKRRMEI